MKSKLTWLIVPALAGVMIFACSEDAYVEFYGQGPTGVLPVGDLDFHFFVVVYVAQA